MAEDIATGTTTTEDFSEYSKMELRIEALRAASRVVAPLKLFVWREGQVFMTEKGDKPPLSANEAVVLIAEQFAKWLETGER